MTARRTAATLLAAYLVALATILLWPWGDLPAWGVDVLTGLAARAGAGPAITATGLVEVLANIAIMVPLALLGALLVPSWGWRDWTALGFVLALTVELVQGLVLPSRDPSALDVVANTTGVALGGSAASALRWLRHRAVRSGGAARG